MKKKKGFTLIELIAVLVILAILALIVTPLVMNIIKKSKDAANKRSVDGYGHAVELAISKHLLRHGSFPTNLRDLTPQYTGKTVECEIMEMKENGEVYLSKCKVNGKDVKGNTKDGYYHYGSLDITGEEYVEMYGNSLERAIQRYYNANNSYPDNYRVLSLDYNGKSIDCDVTINYNGTVYLTNCKVNGIAVTDINSQDGYCHYGKSEQYSIGDEVRYNGEGYFVISDSPANVDYVKVLKSQPLTTWEVNHYGAGHVNDSSIGSERTACDKNGYGMIAYYSSDRCGVVNSEPLDISRCTAEYAQSDIKYVVNSWASAKTNTNDLVLDEFGYYARLITENEYSIAAASDKWNFLDGYEYWTMTPYSNLEAFMSNGRFTTHDYVYFGSCNRGGMVRPVITVKKMSLSN